MRVAAQQDKLANPSHLEPCPAPCNSLNLASAKPTLAVSKRGKAAPSILALAAFHVEVKTNVVGLGFLGLVCLCCLFVIEHFEWLQHWQAAGATGPSSSRGQRLRLGFLSHAL